jgi:RNA polymerase sigma-70 factor (ECF subfamily)
MFRRHRDLHALEQTDDVLQKALLRLYLALSEVKPPNVRAFFALAARQIRWVLLDLIRKHPVQRRPTCVAAGADSEEGTAMPPAPEGEPADLMEWTCFHEVVEGLPDEEREVFDLLFYEGLTQEQAANVLDTSVRTVKRRWLRSRLLLQERLGEATLTAQ